MKQGFTLLELLVSVTIIAGLSILIVQSFFTTTRSSTKTGLLTEIKQIGDFSLNRMASMIRDSASVTSTCAAAGTTATSISIKNQDGGITTFGCVEDSGITRIASSSGIVDYLSSSNVTLGGSSCTDGSMSLQFTCASTANVGTRVTIVFSLFQKGTPIALFERGQASFQTTVTIRN